MANSLVKGRKKSPHGEGREARMTFKEMMKLPLSKDNPTTVAREVCDYLNRAYFLNQPRNFESL